MNDEPTNDLTKDVPPVDRSSRILTNGQPVDDTHREINPITGQQKGYVVLTAQERAKGYVRPVRRSYRHVGKKIERDDEGRIVGRFVLIDDPDYPKNDYYTLEKGYGGYIFYPPSKSPLVGTYVTKREADAIVARKSHAGGCDVVTTMAMSIAETFARDPGFYSGGFCCGCREHFPNEEFVWEGTDEIVGS